MAASDLIEPTVVLRFELVQKRWCQELYSANLDWYFYIQKPDSVVLHHSIKVNKNNQHDFYLSWDRCDNTIILIFLKIY